MKKTGLIITAIVALSLAIAIPVLAVGAHNITLSPAANQNVTGMATVIQGDVGGATPYHNVEVNMKVDQAPPANMVYQGWLWNCKTNAKLSLGAFKDNQLHFSEHMVHFEDTAQIPYDTVAVSVEPAHNPNPNPTTFVSQGTLPGTALTSSNFQSMAVLPQDESFQRQAITQRFGMTSQQFNDMRMMGLQYHDIAFIGNVAAQCKKSPTEIASLVMQGNSWDTIATTCNTTVASLFQPVPSTVAVVPTTPSTVGAGTMPSSIGAGAVCPPGTMARPMFYGMYPNGVPIVTQDTWTSYRDRGYDWQDVAVAANISSQTGERIDSLLRMVRIEGKTWRQLAMSRGLDWNKIKDTSAWPFGNNKGEGAVAPTCLPTTLTPATPSGTGMGTPPGAPSSTPSTGTTTAPGTTPPQPSGPATTPSY